MPGPFVSLKDGGAGGCAARVGVLDDGDHRLVELLRKLPTGFEIHEIVEAKFFALELVCAGDTHAGAVGIERGALVGILAIAQCLGEREVDTEGRGKGGGVGRGRRSGCGASAMRSSVSAMAES